MLGKLLKHEFIYTAKRFIPMYVIYMTICLALRILFVINPENLLFGDTNVMGRAEVMATMLAVMLIIVFGLGIAFLVLYAMFGNIYRFHKNLFTDEGYLMHTLPVPAYNHILCKLITGVVCYLVTLVVVVFGIAVAFLGTEDFFPYGFMLEFKEDILVFVESLAAYCAFLLICYFGEAVSSMAGNKGGIAVLIVIGATILNSIVLSIIMGFVFFGMFSGKETYEYYSEMREIFKIVYYIAVSVGLFFLTHLVMKKRLNLQ